jgi:thiol-disulfide isomerase/thioredoxin
MFRMTLWMVLAAVGVVNPAAPVLARDKQAKPAAALQAGDLAPPLKVSRWLQGDAVPKFEPGKVYVVQFWATWCPAPIRYMPHLARLQARYKDQGVTVISFTSRDIRGVPDNGEEKVAAFVKKRGPTLPYTFAYADDPTTTDVWMKGQEHFCTFVVDRAGRIAYIGGPMFVGMVLPKVVAGASAKAVGDEMAKVVADYQTVCATFERDPEAGLRALAEFEAKYPPLADFLPIVCYKLHEVLKHGTPGRGKEFAEALVTKAIQQNNVFVLLYASFNLRDRKESKELLALAERAAEALVRIEGGTDAQSLLLLAETCLVRGDQARAKEYAHKAIAAAAGESASVRDNIEKAARRLGAEK